MSKKSIFSILFFLISFSLLAQTSLFEHTKTFTKQDSLRGSITPERVWWNLTYYHLNITVNPDKKFINGKNKVQYKVLKPHNVLQIDLQAPLKITKVIQNGQKLKVD